MVCIESPSVTVTRRIWKHGARCIVVSLVGEHDAATKSLLMTVLAGTGEVEDADVIVDMAGVTFIDASAIGAIIWAQERLRWRSHSLEIAAPSAAAFKVLAICDLVGLIRSEIPVAQRQSPPVLRALADNIA